MTIPKAEYQRLCAVEEDLADVRAALAVQEGIDAGTEEFVPETVVDRLIDGEPPLRVWREHRGFSQSALARAADTSRVQIVDIEAGRRTGSVYAPATFRCPWYRPGRPGSVLNPPVAVGEEVGRSASGGFADLAAESVEVGGVGLVRRRRRGSRQELVA